MPETMLEPEETDAPAGTTVKGTESLPQGTVRPCMEADPQGPRDWNDMIVHTGEARGVADTALHSLEPDAPTVGAALRGKDDALDHDRAPTRPGPD